MFALDGERAGLAVEQSLGERGVIDTWDSLLRPAFGALSTLQIEGADCLDVEHLLSRVTTRALQRIPTRSTGSGSADATVLACCDGEAHTLALEALAAALGQSGCAAVMLGAWVPRIHFRYHRTGSAPCSASSRAVVATPVDRRRHCGARMLASAAAEVVVLVAGPGWDGAPVGQRVGRLATLSAAVERLSQLSRV